MQVTVELQDNYSYIPIFLLALAAAVMVTLLMMWAKKEKVSPKKKPEPQSEVPVNPRSRAMEIKRKYDRKLTELAEENVKHRITERETYQRLSRLVRDFAYEMTGVKVQNYTLQELRDIGMPKLTALIEECYVPEFALGNGQINVTDSINKARKVIGEWI